MLWVIWSYIWRVIDRLDPALELHEITFKV